MSGNSILTPWEQEVRRVQELEFRHEIESAVNTISHYFQTLFDNAGLQWDGDNEAEIDGAVRSIVDATLRAAKLEQQEN